MKRMLAALAVGLVSSMVSTAEAQVIFPSGPPMGMGAGASYPAGAYVPPYSYWAAYHLTPSLPPRGYVGLGNDNFPYYGRPYGSPNDPWTWTYLSSDRYPTLSRYYYPPVR